MSFPTSFAAGTSSFGSHLLWRERAKRTFSFTRRQRAASRRPGPNPYARRRLGLRLPESLRPRHSRRSTDSEPDRPDAQSTDRTEAEVAGVEIRDPTVRTTRTPTGLSNQLSRLLRVRMRMAPDSSSSGAPATDGRFAGEAGSNETEPRIPPQHHQHQHQQPYRQQHHQASPQTRQHQHQHQHQCGSVADAKEGPPQTGSRAEGRADSALTPPVASRQPHHTPAPFVASTTKRKQNKASLSIEPGERASRREERSKSR
ncbi:unnamed protein product [Protopolystoma xenopodis]|uniref:Uncharacterized protein n=1 Tax=Protopolystoma xenopodis TaxID=117903 RepID=A0A3S5FH93_9PLAT|nr:unnamed protein product [Protopolystoma xenopodis]